VPYWRKGVMNGLRFVQFGRERKGFSEKELEYVVCEE
jgi:hypothetical protein